MKHKNDQQSDRIDPHQIDLLRSNPATPQEMADRSLDHLLDSLLVSSPLQSPSPWFATQTLSRIRRETEQKEVRALRWIWAGVGAVSLILMSVSFEIHQQSKNEITSLASIEGNNSIEGSEVLWGEP